MAFSTADDSPPPSIAEDTGIPARVMHRPRRIIPALTTAYITGLLVGVYFSVSPLILIGLAISCLMASCWNTRPVIQSILIYGSIIAIGAAVINNTLGIQSPHDLRQQLARAKEFIDVTGRVTSQPYTTVPDATGRTNWVFEFAVESMRRFEGQLPVNGRVRATMPWKEGVQIHYGDRWQLRGTITLDDRPITRTQGLVGFLNVRSEQSNRLAGGAGNSFVDWCYRMREQASERLGWGVESYSASPALTRALLLGLRQDVPRDVHDAFTRTGTLHILALSGMHVVILVFVLVVLLKAIGITRPYWVIVFLPFLTFYTVGTGAAASMVRATIMSVVFFSAFLLRRKPDTATSLALSALIILLVDPLQLFSIGFILSFVAVGGLIALYEPIMNWMSGVRSADPWAETESGWIDQHYILRKKLIGMLSISLAAWLVSLPLIATVFHVISPSALLVNLAMGPLSFVILLTACASVISAFVAAPLVVVFNSANHLFCEMMMGLAAWSAQFPGAYQYVPVWPWFLIVIWYGLLWLWVAQRGWMRTTAAAGLILLITVSLGHRFWSGQVEVVVIPNGDSCVVLLDGPGNHASLIDAGSAYQSRRLVEALRSRGISTLDQVWITRATTDAYGGLSELVRSMEIGEIILPEIPEGRQVFRQQRADWIEQLGSNRVVSLCQIDGTSVPGECMIRVMSPSIGERYRNARDSSLMLHISRGHQSLLYVSRADGPREKILTEEACDWNADLLVIGKCDAPDSLTVPWLEQVNPDRVIFNPRAFDRLAVGHDGLLERIRSRPGLEIELVTDEPWPARL
jgi:ComEC/Rec2-related protein